MDPFATSKPVSEQRKRYPLQSESASTKPVATHRRAHGTLWNHEAFRRFYLHARAGYCPRYEQNGSTQWASPAT